MRYRFKLDIAFSIDTRKKEREHAWWQTRFDPDTENGGLDANYLVLVADRYPYDQSQFDALLERLRRFVKETQAHPVGFTYSTSPGRAEVLHEDAGFGGGWVFITADLIHQESAFDRMIEFQEKVASR